LVTGIVGQPGEQVDRLAQVFDGLEVRRVTRGLLGGPAILGDRFAWLVGRLPVSREDLRRGVAPALEGLGYSAVKRPAR